MNSLFSWIKPTRSISRVCLLFFVLEVEVKYLHLFIYLFTVKAAYCTGCDKSATYLHFLKPKCLQLFNCSLLYINLIVNFLYPINLHIFISDWYFWNLTIVFCVLKVYMHKHALHNIFKEDKRAFYLQNNGGKKWLFNIKGNLPLFQVNNKFR